jgi:hypothetical protein
MAHLLPTAGMGVDLAGGDGAGAQLMAEHGLHPVLVEVSDVALDLARARTMPEDRPLRVVEADLGRDDLVDVLSRVKEADEPTGTGGSITVVTCFHYLMRSLLATIPDALPAGARFLCAINTTTNLERHQRPPRRFLVEPDELPQLVLGPAGTDRPGVSVLHHREGWNQHGLHEAELAIEISP